jgi:hypothetical protein
MGWNVTCYIMGAISIIGPICLIFWYVQGAKEQLSRLNKDKE